MMCARNCLGHLPADGDEFVESGFVDQVAGVVLGTQLKKAPVELGFRDRHFGEQCLNRFVVSKADGGRRAFLDELSMGTRCGIGDSWLCATNY